MKFVTSGSRFLTIIRPISRSEELTAAFLLHRDLRELPPSLIALLEANVQPVGDGPTADSSSELSARAASLAIIRDELECGVERGSAAHEALQDDDGLAAR